uniref:Uncharacterized protein n=1 Tax=Sphaerodactylus townsendi TaxID=933632 RepID=A0ACB8FP78_9SAUR
MLPPFSLPWLEPALVGYSPAPCPLLPHLDPRWAGRVRALRPVPGLSPYKRAQGGNQGNAPEATAEGNAPEATAGGERPFSEALSGTSDRPMASERFFLKLNRNGLPKCPEKPERHCSLFVDLGTSELRKDIYITVHIIRIDFHR